MYLSMLYFPRFNVQNWLKGYELYTIPVDNLTRIWQGTWIKRFFWPCDVFGRLANWKERKIQPTAVPLDTLPERCTMTMHHEILARCSLVPAGDGSTLLSDTLSPTRQWGREKSAPRPHEIDPFRWYLSSTLLIYTEIQPCIYITM